VLGGAKGASPPPTNRPMLVINSSTWRSQKPTTQTEKPHHRGDSAPAPSLGPIA
jgi:hypothetical protein